MFRRSPQKWIRHRIDSFAYALIVFLQVQVVLPVRMKLFFGAIQFITMITKLRYIQAVFSRQDAVRMVILRLPPEALSAFGYFLQIKIVVD